jgi:hypothetical protein
VRTGETHARIDPAAKKAEERTNTAVAELVADRTEDVDERLVARVTRGAYRVEADARRSRRKV